MLIPSVPTIQAETLRPQYHFTAPTGWLNDPNGLVFFKGQYHLFYQHNPFGTAWGNMTWGHAISEDLIHWKDLPNAIEPDNLGTIFSGSAVIDSNNVAGFGKDAIVCFYTAAGGTNDASKGKPFTQCLAYSNDGIHFTKYAGNPIIPHVAGENRDPKVVWDEDHKEWLLALYLTGGTYTLFKSGDLKNWSRLEDVKFPGTDECPDFFPMPYAGSHKWVFTGANGRYMVGSFDGTAFHAETPAKPTNWGNTGYAAQTYFNAPHGEQIQISWMQGSDFPGCSWNQQMAFPTQLKLIESKDGPELTLEPIRNIKKLRGWFVGFTDGEASVPSGLFDFSGEWTIPTSGTLEIKANGVAIHFDAATHKLTALGKDATLDPIDGKLQLRILADVTTVEIYAQGGRVWMPLFHLPKEGDFKGVRLTEGNDWHGKTECYELSSAWPHGR
ncbi:MAG TPA: glycoside hydrolase family 32 protein [Fimbriimonadaceae bacterium]|jgi:sucrose-6-phosphate hydrolase SacC (GH32 family)